MSDPSPPDAMPPGRWHWLVALAMGRAVGTAALLGALYFVLPLDGPFDGSGLAVFGLGLAAVVVVAIWQVAAILRSPHPGVQAVEALVASISLLLVVFAATYYEMARASVSTFGEPLSRVDALYFTITTFATVGFGDIAPASQPARVAVTAQIVIDLIVLGAGLRVLVGAVKVGRRRRSGREDGS